MNEIKNELFTIYSYEDLLNYSTYQLTNGVDILNKFMIYYNSHPTKTKTGELIKELTLAKDAMVENIEKILDRDKKMEIIATKSNKLQEMSINVSTMADTIRKNESMRKNKYVIFASILVGILVILFILLK